MTPTRRPADPSSPRETSLRIRLSRAERAVIEERAAVRGEALSAYMVRVALGPAPLDRTVVMRELFAIRRSLRGGEWDSEVEARLTALLDGAGL